MSKSGLPKQPLIYAWKLDKVTLKVERHLAFSVITILLEGFIVQPLILVRPREVTRIAKKISGL